MFILPIVVIKALNPIALCICFIHCIISKYYRQKENMLFSIQDFFFFFYECETLEELKQPQSQPTLINNLTLVM